MPMLTYQEARDPLRPMLTYREARGPLNVNVDISRG